MNEEKVALKGRVFWSLVDKDGRVRNFGVDWNLTLTDGFEIICDLLGGLGGQTKLQCIAIGDDDTAPAVGQTDLQGAELYYKASTNSRPQSNVARFYVNYAAGEGTGTIKETVIADTVAAKASRKCAARSVIGPIVKGASDTLIVIWEFTFTQA